MAALDFPVGAVLLTGTGIVPDESFSLQAGDLVQVDISGIGTLSNPVVQVGRDLSRDRP
jgi:2-dehydro-3-deoxy-D-arabinonate dehydratase